MILSSNKKMTFQGSALYYKLIPFLVTEAFLLFPTWLSHWLKGWVNFSEEQQRKRRRGERKKSKIRLKKPKSSSDLVKPVDWHGMNFNQIWVKKETSDYENYFSRPWREEIHFQNNLHVTKLTICCIVLGGISKGLVLLKSLWYLMEKHREEDSELQWSHTAREPQTPAATPSVTYAGQLNLVLLLPST